MKYFSNDLGVLNEKYIIKEKLGEGAYSTVYKVQDISTKKEYAAKVIQHYCKSELEINRNLTRLQSPYITKIIDFSQGTIKIRNSEDFKSYYLLELANKGELSTYLNNGKNGFSDIHTKFIFLSILKGFQDMHKAKICHRDIKSDNILLDTDDFNIKICDFGFSSDSPEYLDDRVGTQYYMAPEIINGELYNGIKADIFSLGVLLLNIRTNKFLFDQAKITNNNNKPTNYDYIKNRNDTIWKIAETNGICDLTQEFKELFLRMVAFNPGERPTIEEILNGEWMKEVIKLSESEFIKVKKEVIEEFKERENNIHLKI